MIGIPIICFLLGATVVEPKATVLVTSERLPAASDIIRAYDGFAQPGPKLTAIQDKAGTWYEAGPLRFGVRLVAGAVPDGAADRAAEASLMGFLQEWRPALHTARIVVSMDARPPARAEAATFLRVVGAVAFAASSDAIYFEAYAVTQPAATFVDAIQKDPPLVVGWIGIERRMEGARALFTSRGMALLGLPELTLTAPIEKSAAALTTFLEKLEQAQARPADAKPLPNPWRIDLE